MFGPIPRMTLINPCGTSSTIPSVSYGLPQTPPIDTVSILNLLPFENPKTPPTDIPHLSLLQPPFDMSGRISNENSIIIQAPQTDLINVALANFTLQVQHTVAKGSGFPKTTSISLETLCYYYSNFKVSGRKVHSAATDAVALCDELLV